MRRACLVFLMLPFSAPVFAGPGHDAYDTAVYLQHCWRRPVIFEPDVASKLAADPPPPCDNAALSAWLAARDLESVSSDAVLYMRSIPEPRGPGLPVSSERTWKHIVFDVVVRPVRKNESWDVSDSSNEGMFAPVRRELTARELKEAGDWILQNAALPPATAWLDWKNLPPETARLQFEIALEGVKLSKDGAERIVGWVGGSAHRIILGHFDEGRFALEWLSPLLPDAAEQRLDYRDVDGDGVAEIWSVNDFGAGNQMGWKLAIFNLSGVELTRDTGDCEGGKHLITEQHVDSPLPSACEIIGSSIYHHLRNDDSGKISLEAEFDFRGWDEDTRSYELIGGKYVWTNKPTAADFYKRGQEAYRDKDYWTAAQRFEKAAKADPKNAQYANDAGFAFYKSGCSRNAIFCQDAVFWLKKAIEVDPKRAIAYLNLGDAYRELKNNAEARKAYLQYLELAPESSQAASVKKKIEALATAQ